VTFVCGRHRAFVHERGGQRRLGELTPLTSVTWKRVRDDISTAQANVGVQECCELLSELRTVKMELHIERNGTTVWQGPITRLEYDVDECRVYAEDILWVAKRSAIQEGYNQSYPNIGSAVDRMNWLLWHCYNRDEDRWRVISGRHIHGVWGPDDPRTTRIVFPYQMSVWEDLDKYAEDYGCDYTVINRDIYFSDISLKWLVIAPLDETHLSEYPRIVEYGNQLGTRGIVTNGHGAAGVSAVDTAAQIEYGTIDWITTNEIDGQEVGDPTAQEVSSWGDTATRSIAERVPAPVAVVIPANTTLMPGAPWEINDLVPGAWFQISLSRFCRTVNEWQRLHEIVVTEEAPNGESVKFSSVAAPKNPITYLGPPVIIGEPAPIEPPPEPPEPAPVCITFSDLFQRLDGPIGPFWTVAPTDLYHDVVEVPMSIQGGAAVSPEAFSVGSDQAFGSAQWTGDFVGDDQFIEVCVSGLEYGTTYPAAQQMRGQIRLYCQGDDVTCEREELWLEWSDSRYGAGGGLRWNVYHVLATGQYGDDSIATNLTTPWAPALSDPSACVRLECEASGAVRLYFDLGTAGATTLVASGTSTSGHTGPHVGMRVTWWTTASGTSPRILSARGGCLE
jgi:hypothetical protein